MWYLSKRKPKAKGTSKKPKTLEALILSRARRGWLLGAG
jgi:hypothetical protein